MPKKNRVYTKHKAFNRVYKELKKNPKAGAAGFDAPKKYHHAPNKLSLFTSFVGYTRWSNELYAASTQLISILRNTYGKSEKESSAWHSNKKSLNSILGELDTLKTDLENLYDDIFEFQNCMLATRINQKHAEMEALSDQIRYLVSLENKIIETCNRKLYEISSSRITYANLLVASVALIVVILFR